MRLEQQFALLGLNLKREFIQELINYEGANEAAATANKEREVELQSGREAAASSHPPEEARHHNNVEVRSLSSSSLRHILF